MPYVDVRQPGTGKLLFRYDIEKRCVQIKAQGSKQADTVSLEEVENRQAKKLKEAPPPPLTEHC